MNTLPKLEARVRLHNDTSDRPTQLLGFAELTIGEAFVIKSIRIMRRREPGEEAFVVFPAEKGHDRDPERWYDLAHPCTVEAREAAVRLILEALAQTIKERS